MDEIRCLACGAKRAYLKERTSAFMELRIGEEIPRVISMKIYTCTICSRWNIW